MAIEKLLEFAKDGQKNTDDLNLTDGFPVSKKPARQWFNWLFNSLTSKVNEIIDAEFIPKAEIVDNLTTNDANKVASARTVKELNDSKLSKLDFDDAYKYMPIPYPKLIPPSGFLVMMGQDIVESIHPKLFALYGSKLPDMRAYMIRGLDNGRGIDVNRVILSEQGDAIREIYGNVLGGLVNNIGQESKHTGAFQYKTRSESKTVGAGWGESHSSIASFKASNIVPTASENRVKNIAFLYIVKAG